MRIIFLDDNRLRYETVRANVPFEIKWVETAPATIMELQKNRRVDYLFLDHDLDGQVFVESSVPNTGMDVVRWLERNPNRRINTIVIHSWNPSAALQMFSRLTNIGYNVIYAPIFDSRFIEIMKELIEINVKMRAKERREA
jgi:hypothetical protein